MINATPKIRISLLTGAIAVTFILLSAAASGQTTFGQLNRDQLQLSPIESASAASWGLTEEEWTRQMELRTIHRGLVSADISPLELLGIFADTKAERKRYARMFAEQKLEVLERIAAFERDYLAAFKEITSSGRDKSKQWQLVIEIDCNTEECLGDIRKAISYAEKNERVDAYIINATTDQEIRWWAGRHQIPPKLVEERHFTLNYATPDQQPGLTRQ